MATDDYEDDAILEDDDEAEDDDDLDIIDEDLDIDAIAVDDDDDDDAADDADDDDEVDDEEDDDEVADEAEESLDVLLAREQGDDDALVRLDDEPRDGLVSVTTPIAADEFTCRSCFLVKRRAQLADEKKMICFDCV